jgi:hypothetical protein
MVFHTYELSIHLLRLGVCGGFLAWDMPKGDVPVLRAIAMKECLEVWKESSSKHESDPGIKKDYLWRAVFEGERVIRELNKTDHDRSVVCDRFCRVAALYNASGLFKI